MEQKVQRDGEAQAGVESAVLCVTQRRGEEAGGGLEGGLFHYCVAASTQCTTYSLS